MYETAQENPISFFVRVISHMQKGVVIGAGINKSLIRGRGLSF
jgi:hypothetical protein